MNLNQEEVHKNNCLDNRNKSFNELFEKSLEYVES